MTSRAYCGDSIVNNIKLRYKNKITRHLIPTPSFKTVQFRNNDTVRRNRHTYINNHQAITYK